MAVLARSAVLLVAFGYVERRAPEPMLPLWVFRKRVLVGANATALGIGVLLIGLTSYVPLYAQGVLGHSALVAGFAVAALTLGWPIAAAAVGPAVPADRLPRHGPVRRRLRASPGRCSC